MIVYVATYPRSGGDVLRRAIYRNFGHWTGDGYSPAPALDPMLDARPSPQPEAGFPDDLWWPKWMFTYTGADGVRRRLIGPPALKHLRPKVRRWLAADPCLYFVETHEPPFPHWYPGEKVVRMVRDPLAVIASRFELEAQAAAAKARTLDRLIRGDGIGGDWSAYHRAWRKAAAEQLVFSYEAALHDQAPMVGEIAEFLSLPLVPVVAGTQADPGDAERDPGRGPNRWREVLSPQDIGLIRDLHGETAEEMGYRLGMEEAA